MKNRETELVNLKGVKPVANEPASSSSRSPNNSMRKETKRRGSRGSLTIGGNEEELPAYDPSVPIDKTNGLDNFYDMYIYRGIIARIPFLKALGNFM